MTAIRNVLAIVFLRDNPFWNRSRWHRWARMGMTLGYFYVGVLLVLLALENRFLFPATPASASWFDPPPGLHVEDVSLPGADGNTLHAWWTAPTDWKPADGAVLFCHGNAGNISHRGEILPRWRDYLGLGVLIFDYPGYGKSTGRPSEQGCYQAADAAYAWLLAKGIRPDDVVIFGNSLGGAVAVDLASREKCRALALRAAFTSFPDMAQKTFPWLPARWLVRNRLDNLAKIGTVDAPVFIGHGTADTLVPFAHGERLFASAREPKRFLTLRGHDHNSSTWPDYLTGLKAFLAEMAPRP